MKRRAFLLTAILTMGVVFASLPAAVVRSQSAHSSTSREQIERVKQDYAEALTMIQENYAGKVEAGDLTKASIFGMLHTLDPHSNYFDAKDWEEFQTEQQSQYFGIGATIVTRNGETYIHAPFARTPAERAGLRYGDHIVKVDELSTISLPSARVSEKMRGPQGTTVRIIVERPGVAEPIRVTITRDAVPLPSVTNAFMLQPGVAYLGMNRIFSQTLADEMQQALSALKAEGLNALILDLRDNPGGLIDQAARIVENFLVRGQKIVSVKSIRYPARDLLARSAVSEQFPIVTLINGGSASASEIVAGALQDHDRALIVGERSFGKCLVQTIVNLPYGAGLTLTTGKYYTPSGRLIQREYNGLSYYDYINHRDSNGSVSVSDAPTKDQKLTDGGRSVYGGGGISPDFMVKPSVVTDDQIILIGPIFAFTDLAANGLVPELSAWRAATIERNHIIRENEFPVTDLVWQSFKRFLASSKRFSALTQKAEANAEFVKRQMRYEIAVAHYGVEPAAQVLLREDPQVIEALKRLPVAEKLAQNFGWNSKRSAADPPARKPPAQRD